MLPGGASGTGDPRTARGVERRHRAGGSPVDRPLQLGSLARASSSSRPRQIERLARAGDVAPPSRITARRPSGNAMARARWAIRIAACTRTVAAGATDTLGCEASRFVENCSGRSGQGDGPGARRGGAGARVSDPRHRSPQAASDNSSVQAGPDGALSGHERNPTGGRRGS
jgi:hypothetical protein